MNRLCDKRWAPKYAQIMADIVGRIQRGDWGVGKPIPSLSELSGIYPCNRLTIHKALKHLERDGYLTAVHGRGTFVRQRKMPKLVGMLLGDDLFNPRTTPFCPLLAKAAQDFFHGCGYKLKYYVEHPHLIQSGVPNPDLVQDVETHALGGLMTAGSNAPLALAHADYWRSHPTPYVDISSHELAPHRIHANREAMVELGLELARQRGRRRVGVIGLSADNADKEIGHFKKSALQLGLYASEEWMPLHTEPGEESGYRSLLALWRGAEKPDALIVMDDIMGKGAVQALLRLGIAVPETLLVVCHSNKGSGLFYPVSMPKLELDPAEFVEVAGRLLIELMENPSLPPRTILIEPVLRLERPDVAVPVAQSTTPVSSTG